jgi:hypothetical protein
MDDVGDVVADRAIGDDPSRPGSRRRARRIRIADAEQVGEALRLFRPMPGGALELFDERVRGSLY